MKTTVTTFLILFFTTAGLFAQSEFSLELSANHLTLKPGETKTVQIKLTRYKGYLKSKSKFGFSSPIPKGVTMLYETQENGALLTVSVAEDVKEDSYMILPNCVLNNRSRSVTLRLVVTDDKDTVSTSEH